MKHKRSIQWLHKQLPELINHNIITEETAKDIAEFYDKQEHSQTNLVVILFSILGAALIGSGIISILAHNWDTLPRLIKLILAFTPLLLAQGITLFGIKYKPKSSAWSEGSATFLSLSIAASIALVGQIYHVPGNLADFTLVWMLLTIPVLFLLNSTATYIIYCGQLFMWSTAMIDNHRNPLFFFALVAPLIIDFFIKLIKEGPIARTRLTGWALAITFAVNFGLTLSYWPIGDEFLLIYILLAGAYYLFGHWNSSNPEQPFTLYSFSLIGLWSLTIISVIGSFSDFWEHALDSVPPTILFASALLSVILLSVAYFRKHYDCLTLLTVPVIFSISSIAMTSSAFVPFFPALILNIYLLVQGIAAITSGIRHTKLGTINFGMALLSTVILIRFFDSDLSFITRGIIFILIGAGFLATNIVIVKRRQKLIDASEVQV